MVLPRPLLLLAALLFTPSAAGADVSPGNPWPPAGTGDPVALYRGTRANVPPSVPVHRGSSAAGSAAAPVGAAAERPPEFLAAGSRLWIVDRDGDTLTACRLGPTYRVGRDRVRCVARDLPDGAD